MRAHTDYSYLSLKGREFPSSSGLGLQPLTLSTWVRLPLGTPMKSSRSKEDLVLDLFNGQSSLKIRKQAETKKNKGFMK